MVPFRLDSVLLGFGIADTLIKMGDKIRVFSKSEIIGQIASTVTASGSFKNPGVFDYFEGMTFRMRRPNLKKRGKLRFVLSSFFFFFFFFNFPKVARIFAES